jgi:heat shock protein beta
VVDEAATKKRQEEVDKIAAEKGEEPVEVEPVMKTDYEDVFDWRVENDNKPLWTRSPKDVSETDYNEFFKLVGVGSMGAAFRIEGFGHFGHLVAQSLWC